MALGGALLLLLLSSMLQSARGLMLRSAAVAAHWDTWGFFDEDSGTYYAFSLVTEISPGEGFIVASSKDGVRWRDHGCEYSTAGCSPTADSSRRAPRCVPQARQLPVALALVREPELPRLDAAGRLARRLRRLARHGLRLEGGRLQQDQAVRREL